jgi:hypothetical protein
VIIRSIVLRVGKIGGKDCVCDVISKSSRIAVLEEQDSRAMLSISERKLGLHSVHIDLIL